jgi:hypothetical protein
VCCLPKIALLGHEIHVACLTITHNAPIWVVLYGTWTYIPTATNEGSIEKKKERKKKNFGHGHI